MNYMQNNQRDAITQALMGIQRPPPQVQAPAPIMPQMTSQLSPTAQPLPPPQMPNFGSDPMAMRRPQAPPPPGQPMSLAPPEAAAPPQMPAEPMPISDSPIY